MRTHSLDLMFLAPKKGDLSGPPVAEVYLKTSSRVGYRGYEDRAFITHRCLSFGEFREEIKRLKGELDKIEKAAKRKFAAFA